MNEVESERCQVHSLWLEQCACAQHVVGVNPAEFAIDLVSIDHESQTQAMKDCS